MPASVFSKGDFLLPTKIDIRKWSIIACDQFTSDPGYWAQVERIVGDNPSALRLMLPEVYLPSCDVDAETRQIKQNMRMYFKKGTFKVIENSFIYVERVLSSGSIRRGLIGVLDLESYEYSECAKDSSALIRSTEGAVPDRLPPRIRGRQGALLEMPHILVFIDDPEHTVIDPIIYAQNAPEMLYDFDLMMDGGHITGWRVCDGNAEDVERALANLRDPEILEKKYHIQDINPVIFAVGDGNHSLAAARLCWEEIREGLSEEDRLTHPARYSMVELVNIHDSSIVFEPIHRVIFRTDSSKFIDEARAYLLSRKGEAEAEYDVEFCTYGRSEKVNVRGLDISRLIASCEDFAQEYIKAYGGRIDYVHDNAAVELGSQKGNASIILPAMKKSELFSAIIRNGVFPRKSFSIGSGKDKKYYLECRRITAD